MASTIEKNDSAEVDESLIASKESSKIPNGGEGGGAGGAGEGADVDASTISTSDFDSPNSGHGPVDSSLDTQITEHASFSGGIVNPLLANTSVPASSSASQMAETKQDVLSSNLSENQQMGKQQTEQNDGRVSSEISANPLVSRNVSSSPMISSERVAEAKSTNAVAGIPDLTQAGDSIPEPSRLVPRTNNVDAPLFSTPPSQQKQQNFSLDDTLDDYIRSPEVQNSIVERSPGGRYIRFMEKLGSGASKDVYRAYDTQEGIEVAWNVVTLSGVPKTERNRIVNEVRLLERLHHSNIISFHGSWVNREKQEVIFVTEILSSGTLKSFIAKVQVIRWKIAKRWAKQILQGLEYLHSQDPPIIHRDLKCENVFINGTSGDLRIGDLGLSTVHRHGRVLSVLGTPEFMAPDMYEERSYDEKVDIYAFGMCMLEIFTKEIPYSECNNPAQIYRKVSSGEPPEVLSRLESRHARAFVQLCLGYKNEDGFYVRPSASELLKHPFLMKRPSDEDEVVVERPLRERAITEGTESSNGSSLQRNRHGQDMGLHASAALSQSRLSPTQGDDYDQFDEMPESETNIKKVKVLMGRDQVLTEDDEVEAQPSMDSSVPAVDQGAPVYSTYNPAQERNPVVAPFIQVEPFPPFYPSDKTAPGTALPQTTQTNLIHPSYTPVQETRAPQDTRQNAQMNASYSLPQETRAAPGPPQPVQINSVPPTYSAPQETRTPPQPTQMNSVPPAYSAPQETRGPPPTATLTGQINTLTASYKLTQDGREPEAPPQGGQVNAISPSYTLQLDARTHQAPPQPGQLNTMSPSYPPAPGNQAPLVPPQPGQINIVGPPYPATQEVPSYQATQDVRAFMSAPPQQGPILMDTQARAPPLATPAPGHISVSSSYQATQEMRAQPQLQPGQVNTASPPYPQTHDTWAPQIPPQQGQSNTIPPSYNVHPPALPQSGQINTVPHLHPLTETRAPPPGATQEPPQSGQINTTPPSYSRAQEAKVVPPVPGQSYPQEARAPTQTPTPPGTSSITAPSYHATPSQGPPPPGQINIAAASYPTQELPQVQPQADLINTATPSYSTMHEARGAPQAAQSGQIKTISSSYAPLQGTQAAQTTTQPSQISSATNSYPATPAYPGTQEARSPPQPMQLNPVPSAQIATQEARAPASQPAPQLIHQFSVPPFYAASRETAGHIPFAQVQKTSDYPLFASPKEATSLTSPPPQQVHHADNPRTQPVSFTSADPGALQQHSYAAPHDTMATHQTMQANQVSAVQQVSVPTVYVASQETNAPVPPTGAQKPPLHPVYSSPQDVVVQGLPPSQQVHNTENVRSRSMSYASSESGSVQLSFAPTQETMTPPQQMQTNHGPPGQVTTQESMAAVSQPSQLIHQISVPPPFVGAQDPAQPQKAIVPQGYSAPQEMIATGPPPSKLIHHPDNVQRQSLSFNTSSLQYSNEVVPPPAHKEQPPQLQPEVVARPQSELSQLHYLVAAAVIEDEGPNIRPYADDLLQLVVTLPVEGQTQNVQFAFHLVEDDAVQVAKEMVLELDIPRDAVLEISETISGLARAARMKQDKYSARMRQQQPPGPHVMTHQQQQAILAPNQPQTTGTVAEHLVSPPLAHSKGPYGTAIPSEQKQQTPQATHTPFVAAVAAENSSQTQILSDQGSPTPVHVPVPLSQQTHPGQGHVQHDLALAQHPPSLAAGQQGAPATYHAQVSQHPPPHPLQSPPHQLHHGQSHVSSDMLTPQQLTSLVQGQQGAQVTYHGQTQGPQMNVGQVSADTVSSQHRSQQGISATYPQYPPQQMHFPSDSITSQPPTQSPGQLEAPSTYRPQSTVSQNSPPQSSHHGQSHLRADANIPQNPTPLSQGQQGAAPLYYVQSSVPQNLQSQPVLHGQAYSPSDTANKQQQASGGQQGIPQTYQGGPLPSQTQQIYHGQTTDAQEVKPQQLVSALGQQANVGTSLSVPPVVPPTSQSVQHDQGNLFDASMMQDPHLPQGEQPTLVNSQGVPVHQQGTAPFPPMAQPLSQASHQSQSFATPDERATEHSPPLGRDQHGTFAISQQGSSSSSTAAQGPVQRLVASSGALAQTAPGEGQASLQQHAFSTPVSQAQTIVSGPSRPLVAFPVSEATTLGSSDAVSNVPEHDNMSIPTLQNFYYSDEDEINEEMRQQLRKLEEDYQKNLKIAKKVFDSRMENLARSQTEKEAQHLKTLEKHEKERADFEKKRVQEEQQQMKRIEQIQKEWDKKREILAQQIGASVNTNPDLRQLSSPLQNEAGQVLTPVNGAQEHPQQQPSLIPAVLASNTQSSLSAASTTETTKPSVAAADPTQQIE